MMRALVVATAILAGAWTQMAEAVPIVYLGTLQSGVPVSDTVPNGGPSNPDLADYWQFTLDQAAQVTITGHRRQADLDPAFFVFRGTFADTSSFGGDLFGPISALVFADDNIPEPSGLEGPFSDPQATLQLPAGTYTVAFVSFDNNGPGPFAYCLELNGPASCNGQVPLPAPLLLVGLGVGMIGMVRRLRYGRI